MVLKGFVINRNFVVELLLVEYNNGRTEVVRLENIKLEGLNLKRL